MGAMLCVQAAKSIAPMGRSYRGRCRRGRRCRRGGDGPRIAGHAGRHHDPGHAPTDSTPAGAASIAG